MPRVAVVIPSYNHEKFVKEAIQSVLDQTFQDFEIIITDDGSSDNSVSEIKTFNDSRIKLTVFKRNQGAYFAVKNCLEHVDASVEFIAMLSSDDVWKHDKLEKQVAFLDNEENNSVAAVFSFAEIIDEDGSILKNKSHPYMSIFKQYNRNRYEWLNYFFFNGNCLCHPSSLVRKEFYTIDQFDPRYRQLPDFDFWIKLCMKADIHIMSEEMIQFRILNSEKNTSGENKLNGIRVVYEYRKILDNFRTIDSIDMLSKIFQNELPDSKEYTDKDVLYLLSRIALDSKNEIVKYFGLELLFDISAHADNISDKFNYDYNLLQNETWKYRITLHETNFAEFFCDTGAGFNCEEKSTQIIEKQNCLFEYNLPANRDIKAIRFDPVNEKSIIIIRSIQAVTIDGKTKTLSSAINNADYVDGNTYYYFHDDPQIIFPDIGKDLTKIEIELFYANIGDEQVFKAETNIKLMQKSFGMNFLNKLKCYRVLKKALKKILKRY